MAKEWITPFTYAIGVVLVFVIAICSFAVKTDLNSQSYCDDAVHEFVDTSRSVGYISANAYMKMMDKITSTGNLYEVEIMHQSAQMVPSTQADGTEIPGKFGYSYSAYYDTEILRVVFPEGGDSYGTYAMKNGDYLKVNFRLKQPTLGSNLIGLFSKKGLKTIYGSYGGYVGSTEENGIM